VSNKEWKPTIQPDPDRRRWGNWLAGLAFVLAFVAALSTDACRSSWWPPVLATVFTVAFCAQIADAYRTGIAHDRFGRWDRYKQPAWFNLAVGTYLVFALFCATLAVALWWEFLAGVLAH
jgi:hypothetical protein